MPTEKVYQLHISLEYIKPTIWRRFLVKDSITLAKLHKIIQTVMGWENFHLFEFRIDGNKYGPPNDDPWHDDIKDVKKFKLRGLDLVEKSSFGYLYDFGDNWLHNVTVEKIEPANPRAKYPKCLDGAMACPPEDCFGPPGYESLAELTRHPPGDLDDDEVERLSWLGDFDFEYFSVRQVNAALRKRFTR